MKYRDAFFVLLATGAALSSLTGIAASGYGAAALQAESAGFDALAFQVFGGKICHAAELVADQGRTR